METSEFFADIRTSLQGILHFPGADTLITLILLLAIAICAVAGYYIALLVLKGVAKAVEWTDTDWDDDLINEKFRSALSQLSPALIVAWLMPKCFVTHNILSGTIHILSSFYIIGAMIFAANTLVDNLLEAFGKREKLQPFAIKGIFQMVKLIFIGIGIIIALSLLIGRSPIAILTALGASAAILMLVFKDTILGLVAGVQLTANDMVHKGDWIMVPKHDANGEVTDISLTTVKIRNWDNSVTTVPPYSLVSESFQNFQTMRDLNARRVMRAFYIDANSVRFITPDEVTSLRNANLLPPVQTPQKIVNLRLLRDYLEHWLSQQDYVRTDLTYMVRQLAPTPSGLPVEIYFYANETQWKPFEHIQSDVFDHVYAVVPLFGLSIFQTPAGTDLMKALP